MPKRKRKENAVYLYLLSIDDGENEFMSLFWEEDDIPCALPDKLEEAGIELTEEEIGRLEEMTVSQAVRFANSIEGLQVEVVPFEPNGVASDELIEKIREAQAAEAEPLKLVRGGKAK